LGVNELPVLFLPHDRLQRVTRRAPETQQCLDEQVGFINYQSRVNSIQVIADGVAYRFELFMKNKKRRYWYSNPETKLKEMGEEYPEFINAVKIIQILDNELGFNEKTLAECK
jgi:hypothetical protein